MTSSFDQKIKELVVWIEKHRPDQMLDDLNLFYFLNDLANIFQMQRVIPGMPLSSGMEYIYLDLYGSRVDPKNWTMQDYVNVILAHRDTHCFFETVKDIKKVGRPIPQIVGHVVDWILSLDPLPRQEELTDAVEHMSGIVLALDFIRSHGFDQSPDRRNNLNQAVENLFASLSVLFPDFKELADQSYRNLGYFELDPFSRRVTADAWIKATHTQANSTATGQGVGSQRQENVWWILGTIFSPRIRDLSRPEHIIIDTMLRKDAPMTEEEIVGGCGY